MSEPTTSCPRGTRLVLPHIKSQERPRKGKATHAGESCSGIEGPERGPVLAVDAVEADDTATQEGERSYAQCRRSP